ncbi:MAG TPA: DUF1611 domain-containing protein [Thermoguttaceae bacterium]|nr:DUF1611 domain-containing protein [Thermoguttaceae bacterium]HUU94359.1 DUF1611 domain-containing protein [Phycisphaerae bacterium]
MSTMPEGNAIVYCEGAFGTTNGKTAHGLVRRTRRYRVLAVVDSRLTGKDAGQVLDGKANGVPIQNDVPRAFKACQETGTPATHLVIGLAPDGGRLPPQARRDIVTAIRLGLHVDCGLHDFLSEDEEIAELATSEGVRIRDIRRTPPRSDLHFFSGKIEHVDCLKVAVLGTDSAVGKRTTAWLLVDGFEAAGFQAELVGTGQTAWMQGARYSVMMDSLINDFVAGEIEHAVWSAWHEQRPDVVIIEGQGSLMNPAYPGGFEILAAGRPDVVVLQHAPARKEYDGFPGYPIHPLEQQIHAIELVSGKPVVAITINHEGMATAAVPEACRSIWTSTGVPTYDVLLNGGRELCALLSTNIPARQTEGGTQIPRGTRTRAERKGRAHADAS